jgi:hypothetical protein
MMQHSSEKGQSITQPPGTAEAAGEVAYRKQNAR